MQTRTQPKRTGQQAVNFGPNLLQLVDRSPVRPLGRSFLLAARRSPARRHRVGNLYRVIHRILVRASRRSLRGSRRRRRENFQSLFATPQPSMTGPNRTVPDWRLLLILCVLVTVIVRGKRAVPCERSQRSCFEVSGCCSWGAASSCSQTSTSAARERRLRLIHFLRRGNEAVFFVRRLTDWLATVNGPDCARQRYACSDRRLWQRQRQRAPRRQQTAP